MNSSMDFCWLFLKQKSQFPLTRSLSGALPGMVSFGLNMHICRDTSTGGNIVLLNLKPSSAAHQLRDTVQVTWHLCSSVYSDSRSIFFTVLTQHDFLRIFITHLTRVLHGLNELILTEFLEKGLSCRSSKINFFKN